MLDTLAGTPIHLLTGRPLLDPDALIESAMRTTGLEGFGEPAVDEPLRVLTRALEDEARLSVTGRFATRMHLLDLLANRLRLAEERRQDPAIREQRIERPIFITGMPRSGTTLLHALLAQDPDNRVPRHWEVMFPTPAPEAGADSGDPRIARAKRRLRFATLMRPKLKTVHLLGATLPEECVTITASSFRSFLFDEMYRVPSYQRWLKARGKRETYRYHKRFLQHLQSRSQARRWVLKSPSHMFALDAVFETYPDARVIQTHRHPFSVLPSTASLEALLLGMFSKDVDRSEIGREVADSVADQVGRAMQFRDRLNGESNRFFDVSYAEFMRDPVGMVAKIYGHFAIPWTSRIETTMRTFLTANPQHKNGRHVYRFEDFGLDAPAIERLFAPYCERYGIAREAA